MSGLYTYPYHFDDDEDKAHYQAMAMGTSNQYPWAYDSRNAPTLHMPGPQANETDKFKASMSTMLDNDPKMHQYEPINAISGFDWDMSTDASSQWTQYFHSTVDDSQCHLNELGESSGTTSGTNSSPPVPGDEDLNLWGAPESQESQAEFVTQANENSGFDFNQPLPIDNNDSRGLFGSSVYQGVLAEATSSAPFQQGEGQLRQPGAAQLTLPQLTMPLEGAPFPSSQTSNQSQVATAPLPAPGQYLTARPSEEQYPTPESISEGHQGAEPQPRRRKPRVVGKNSCERCRRSKVRCLHTPSMEKCRRCEEKGFQCVVSGVDHRTNKSAGDELNEVLKKSHALIQESVALLYLLSHRGARDNEKDHWEARRFFSKSWNPTKILECCDKRPSEYFPVENVRELNKHTLQFEKLEERRAAIKEADEYGIRVMRALYNVCIRVASKEISERDVDQILGDAKYGRFRHQALQ
ncbi:uncharacterized protein F4807DRAFT_456256 [Annulohypoxylon truncatum]|uniref:uncharacterized protein n=1 Tax=Annulohypoxylon truncatum TaxID=327061 RepID=UPI0020088ECC|nr:uncharacterized protein F4807DRAFT_456256 [Annulohypoxylon truncatum]KAI1213709.1 hypothetical protein F4807DRAFT_456256 [Annulohypoxylon truncatum]